MVKPGRHNTEILLSAKEIIDEIDFYEKLQFIFEFFLKDLYKLKRVNKTTEAIYQKNLEYARLNAADYKKKLANFIKHRSYSIF